MNGVIKSIIIILAIAVIAVGLYSGYQAIENYLDGKIAVERNRVASMKEANDAYKSEATATISALGEDIINLKAKNIELEAEKQHRMAEIVTIRATITDLERAAVDLTDITDKYNNAMLQIAEYKTGAAAGDGESVTISVIGWWEWA